MATNQSTLIPATYGINRLQERYSLDERINWNLANITRLPGRKVEVYLHKTDDTEELPRLLKICIRRYNEENQEPLQICAYYCTVLISYFPALEGSLVGILKDCGATVRTITNARERRMEILAGDDDSSVNLCYFGQAVLLLYKNISSYQNFMRDRTNELQTYAGVPPNATVAIAFNQHAAATIRSMLGNNHKMRKLILEALLAAQRLHNPLGYVCNYLCKNLEWTDMDSIICIVNTLVISKSPVLRNPRLAVEVQLFSEAYNKVKACPMPQFFAIWEPPSVTCVMDSTRFPMITAVAKAIRGRNVAAESALVAELRQVHDTYMRNSGGGCSFSVELVE